ncbi:hypothetical protein QOZ80_5BG0449000 [Eleusine coracana subsp. coracana]|nr:hypothetical protein QOZ80_5BG0449000 [Eleusine coracana subsp. coracana]
MSLCGSPVCVKQAVVVCALKEFFDSSTCMNHLLVIGINMLLVIILALHLVVRVLKSGSLQQLVMLNSPLHFAAILFHGCLGLAYLGLGLWMMGSSFDHDASLYLPHWWLVNLSQGISLILISFAFSIQARVLGVRFVRFWSVLLTIYAAYMCCSSAVYMLSDNTITTKTCLDVLFLPGSLLLLIHGIWHIRNDGSERFENALYKPLNTETVADKDDSGIHVTPFAKAGVFSLMSFWWLNPLIKVGYEKPLEEKDMPLLGPLILKAFINVSLGKGTFKYEGYALAAAMFVCKCCESLSQRQWYFRTRRIGLQVRKKYHVETEYPIVINTCSFSWDENPSKTALKNINLVVRTGEKVAICGEVGSGKSTLLAAALGEISKTEGTIQVCGKIAYVSQNAWIQTGTVQDNILFGSSMDEKRYQETLLKCSLVKDLQNLPYGDCTQIGERGVNLSGGQKQRVQLARALYQNADIYLLDDPFSAVDAHTATNLFNEYVMGALSDKTVLLVTHQVDFLPVFDCILLMSDGEIIRCAPYQDLLAHCQEFQNLVNAHKDIIGISDTNDIGSHRAMEITTEEKTEIRGSRSRKHVKPPPADQLIKQEEREMGDTGLKPYMLYLCQKKGFLYAFLCVISHIIFTGAQISQNSWMAANVQNPNTSRSLFSQLLNSLFRTPISFFDSTPLGRVLSRVSSDLSIVDLDVPFAFVFSISASLNAYSNLGVLSVVTWQVLFVCVPMICLAIKLQRYYLTSAKELMRINGTTKSALANHLGESILGAVTIRAFNGEDRFFAESLELVDKNAGPYFYNFAATEWLIQRLETMIAVVLSFSAFIMALLPAGTFSPGFVGMALSYGLSLNVSFVSSIQKQCTLANQIISVERVNQYMDIQSEAAEVIEEKRPAPDWPQVGTVELRDLKIRYRKDSPLVLHGITCTFEGGDKIGIVGRTGSGKTTLIGALFRLVEPAGGKIIIDSIDITTIGLHDLRSRLGIIPQDPTLFQGTVRYNLDPLGQFSDKTIWEVLDKCQLLEAVQEKENGLDSIVVEDGSNWSMGQRQLFCLGRALLRRCRILVLDEATASVDNATDVILQKTIRTEFNDCTVITVAHRVPTVMDCSMVLAMSDGKVAEYEQPMKLMETEGSLFRELVKEYWSHTPNGKI